jgi:hypothetical protein
MPALARTASNDAVNYPVRSRTRNRKPAARSPRSIRRGTGASTAHEKVLSQIAHEKVLSQIAHEKVLSQIALPVACTQATQIGPKPSLI